MADVRSRRTTATRVRDPWPSFAARPYTPILAKLRLSGGGRIAVLRGLYSHPADPTGTPWRRCQRPPLRVGACNSGTACRHCPLSGAMCKVAALLATEPDGPRPSRHDAFAHARRARRVVRAGLQAEIAIPHRHRAREVRLHDRGASPGALR